MEAAITNDITVARRKKPASDTKLRQETVSRLDKFFGQVPYSVKWEKPRGGKTLAHITYTDFLSERLAGQMLSDVVPEGVCFSFSREYSDRAVSQVLLQEYRKNKVAVVDCYGGELHPETVQAFVGRKLEAVEML